MLRRILPLTKHHLEHCTELILSVFNNAPWHENWAVESARALLQEMIETPGFMGFVSLAEEQVIGFVAGYSEQRDQTKCFCIREICVHLDYQGQGIGSDLLQHLEQKLANLDIHLIYLITMREGQAESFYLKNGYRHSARIVMLKDI